MTKVLIMVSGGNVTEVRSDDPALEVTMFDMDLAEEFDDQTEKMYEELYDYTKKQYPHNINPVRPKEDEDDIRQPLR